MARFLAFNEKLQAIYRDVPKHDLLNQLERYRALGQEFAGDAEIEEIVGSFVSWKLSALGRIHEAHRVFGESTPLETPAPEELRRQQDSFAGSTPLDALTALTEASRWKQAVFLNEGHHVPQHRVLTLQLLPRLRAAGFTHFAAETLTEGSEELNTRGYPSPRSGTYLDEPLYADIVRTAQRLGFEIVRYESSGPPRKRETGQARHLMERVFAVDPDARLVVHLGFGHNRESAESFKGVGAMAYHFKTMTGIDPLTIDQTTLSEQGEPSLEHPLYARACAERDTPSPVVFGNTEGTLWSLDIDRDITVCHPRTRLEEGRPTWLVASGLRQVARLDRCGTVTPCVVEARWANEGDDAIPVDRVLRQPGEPMPALLLPEGRFTVTAHGLDGPVGEPRHWVVGTVEGTRTAPEPSP